MTPSGPLVGRALFCIVTAPFTWPIILVKRAIHLGLLLMGWWFLRDNLAPYDLVVLTLGVIAIYYKGIYSECVQFLIYLLIVITRGGASRWVCDGYLAGNPLRRRMLDEELINVGIVWQLGDAMSEYWRRPFLQVLECYTSLNETPAPPHAPGSPEALSENEKHLEGLLDDYWKEREQDASSGRSDE